MNKPIKRLAVALVLVLLCSLALYAESITLKLNWVPGGDHCFYFVAKELGYYSDNGLDVRIERGHGSGDTVKRVEIGTADIGLADTGTLVVARSQGAKVKVVAMIYSNSPNGIKTRADTGIRSPKDLEGKTVGVPAGDAQRVLWPALAGANNVDADAVRLINIKPGAKPQVLAAKRVDAVFDWVVGNLNYWQAGLDKDQLVLIPWAEWGVNPYGNALMASEKTIRERPDTIRRFLDATMKAWRWSIQNPKRAIEIFTENAPEVPPIAAEVRFVDDLTRLVDVETAQTRGMGFIERERMQATVDNINRYFDVERSVTAGEMYTSEFLPDYKMPSISHLPSAAELYRRWKASQ